MTSVLPDRDSIARHLNWLVMPALAMNSSLRVEIAWGQPNTGPNCAKTFCIDMLDSAADFAFRINKVGSNVYVGVTLKSADTPPDGRTNSSHASLAVCLPIDIDNQLNTGLKKLKKMAVPQLIVLTGLTPEPRGQAWISIEPTSDMGLWKDVNGRSIHSCGGDRNALGTYRLMRLAGTVSYPSPGKKERGYITELTAANYYDAPIYKVEDLLKIFPEVTKQESRPSGISLNDYRSARSLPVNPVNVAIVQSMLKALPDSYVIEHDLWLRVGFALHSYDPFEIGFALWMKFSERDPKKFAETNFPRKWNCFGRPYDGKKITIGWLEYHAKKHGWKLPCRWDCSTILKLDGMI